MYLWKIRYAERMKFYIKITLKKLFNEIYRFSLRKHSAKAVSSGFDNSYIDLFIYLYPV